MMSATDALVEALVPQAHAMLIEWRVRETMDSAAREHAELAARLTDEQIDKTRRVLIDSLREKLGDIDGAPRGAAVERWEGRGAARPWSLEVRRDWHP
jgi:hypothetical protein